MGFSGNWAASSTHSTLDAFKQFVFLNKFLRFHLPGLVLIEGNNETQDFLSVFPLCINSTKLSETEDRQNGRETAKNRDFCL
jgi:hypothetical protein